MKLAQSVVWHNGDSAVIVGKAGVTKIEVFFEELSDGGTECILNVYKDDKMTITLYNVPVVISWL